MIEKGSHRPWGGEILFLFELSSPAPVCAVIDLGRRAAPAVAVGTAGAEDGPAQHEDEDDEDDCQQQKLYPKKAEELLKLIQNV